MSVQVIYPMSTSDYRPGGIELNPEKRIIRPFRSGEINGIPGEVWHKRTLWFCFFNPMETSLDEARAMMDDIADDAGRICDGYDRVWDGCDFVGRYTDEAQRLIDKVGLRVGKLFL